MKALILDDELYCTEAIALMITKYCQPPMETITFTDSHEALAYLQTTAVDILFLDIEMPSMSGFEFLQKLQHFKGSVIFTTAYDHYALKAIKADAVDYLLKPIDKSELLQAIDKAMRLKQAPEPDVIREMIQLIDRQITQKDRKVAIPAFDGTYILDIHDIIRCESDGSYSFIHLTGAKPMMVSKNLRELETLLSSPVFFRVHKSHLINLNHIRFISRQDGGDVQMSDGSSVPVSRNTKQEFFQRIKA